MDCVILAAGKNTRLQGIIPAYHKPLLVVNGETLLVRLVRQAALLMSKGNRIILVVSPLNCQAIMDLMRSSFTDEQRLSIVYLCQDTDATFADTLSTALTFSQKSEKVLLMCGDNYVSDNDWDVFVNVCMAQGYPVATWASSSIEQTDRFAKILPVSGCITSASSEDSMRNDDGNFLCWLGPIVIQPALTQTRLKRQERRDVIADALMAGGQEKHFFPVDLNVQDIGVPDALPLSSLSRYSMGTKAFCKQVIGE